jgi:hypothetical protein
LCWRCYYTPGVSERYPSTSKYCPLSCLSPGRDGGIPDYCGPSQPPEGPTVAPAGSPEKIAVLADRAAARRELWHPADSCTVVTRPAAVVGRGTRRVESRRLAAAQMLAESPDGMLKRSVLALRLGVSRQVVSWTLRHCWFELRGGGLGSGGTVYGLTDLGHATVRKELAV